MSACVQDAPLPHRPAARPPAGPGWTGEPLRLAALLAPAAAVFAAFFLLPLVRLILIGAGGAEGWSTYLTTLADPGHLDSLISTLALSAGVTLVTLAVSTVAGLFLVRNRFPGHALLVALLTFPLAFPGVVIGFMVIMLAGRQGLIGTITQALGAGKLVFAYSMAGLFLGYVYFSIPRVILTVMAAAEKLDPRLEEAARSLGASSWRVVADVILPALKPALISAGALCFATSMGAFGTAFTLATRINVLPMTIYTEFTLQANIAAAAALSVLLGLITWAALAVARSVAGTSVAAAG
ncbi:putative spermidine/putrescine transport system permease protein [Azospirillum lipoferum]|uniref:ABC transporter permease n=1 Tax=Azospirillum TaxID=191 RepID=UPI001FEC126B|nr:MULTISPECIES: ABC transporter permease [Azospirillum]MCP1614605.1 putative spermidine/putrescine transport system permease protein [Azospirillum lipoferum]MDW5532564.1 ABC transporter permease [Azospirillum sp. NL1]